MGGGGGGGGGGESGRFEKGSGSVMQREVGLLKWRAGTFPISFF